jgi:Arc/MetJ family transcription regulator
MQITLDLDESLLSEALQLTNLTTQEELVNLALQESVRSRRKKNLLDLVGQIQFTEDFDHKALRETRVWISVFRDRNQLEQYQPDLIVNNLTEAVAWITERS